MRKVKLSCLGPAGSKELPPKGLEAKAMKKHWDEYFDYVLPENPDLIVLHECCNRFPNMTMEERLSYYDSASCQEVFEYFCKKAKDNNCNIAYSAIRKLADNTRRNSTQLIGRDGKVLTIYDKNFPMIEEAQIQNILPGEKEVILESEFGKIGFAICFDLNFDHLRLRYAKQKPNLLLFSSMYHGGIMQQYWAYSCRSYFAGAVSQLECAIINPLGKKIAASTNYYPFVTAQINTDYEIVHLDGNQEKIKEAIKKYGSKIKVDDPGHLGSVLITSECEEFTAAQIVDEFKMLRLDDYFNKVMNFFDK
jgi:hypothetical protein